MKKRTVIATKVGRILAFFSLLLVPKAPAVAQEKPSPKAKQLAIDGKISCVKKNFEDGLRQLEESLALAPDVEVLYALAKCFELDGKTATALARYKEGREMAREAGQDASEQDFERRITALTPRLSYLIITMPQRDCALNEVSVKRNEEVVGSEQWGNNVAVDHGDYTVTVEISGERQFEKRVAIKAEGATEIVLVPEHIIPECPKVEAPPLAPPQPVDPPKQSSSTSWPRWTAAGVGVGAFATGSVLLRLANRSYQDFDDKITTRCTVTSCTPEMVADITPTRDRADRYRCGSIAAVGIGTAAAGMAIYLFIRSSDDKTPTTERTVLVPVADHGSIGLTVHSRF